MLLCPSKWAFIGLMLLGRAWKQPGGCSLGSSSCHRHPVLLCGCAGPLVPHNLMYVSVASYTVADQPPLRPAAATVSVAAAASPVAQRNGSAACRTRSDAVCGGTEATARGPALIKLEPSARYAILGRNSPGNIPAPFSASRHGAPWRRRWRAARWGLTPP